MSEYEKVKTQNIWIPEKETDFLEGEVSSVNEGIYGKQWSIKQKDGNITKTPSHKVLQACLESISIGDTVKIVFMGQQPPKIRGQNPTSMYDVFRKK